MHATFWRFAASCCLMASVATPAAATQISDPTGDYLPSYTGPANGDLDLVSANVGFDGVSFSLGFTAAGDIGTTPNSLFVWAVNRGSGIARPAAAPPAAASLLWDAVVVMFPDGTLRVVTFPAAGPPSITNLLGGATVAGDSISGSFLASLLPSTGFAFEDYTFSAWSRVRVNAATDGSNSEVADLLAGSGSIQAVPEPASWLMMLLGFGFVGWTMRNTRVRGSLRSV